MLTLRLVMIVAQATFNRRSFPACNATILTVHARRRRLLSS